MSYALYKHTSPSGKAYIRNLQTVLKNNEKI